MKIGKKLKELRLAHGYTQEELAAILNVARSTISSWEINRTYPDLSILVSLSELYNITVDQLIHEDDQLINTMTNQTKKNDVFKKLIFTLVVALLSFAIVFVFILKGNSTQPTEITHYAFSDYSEIVKKKKDGDNSVYFYQDYFIGKIIDTLPDGTKTTLEQPTIVNSGFDEQATLNIKRDENHKIKKVSVVQTKSTIQLVQDEYGGNIRMVAYDSWEESEKAIKAVEASSSEQLVFIKSDNAATVSAFFKADEASE